VLAADTSDSLSISLPLLVAAAIAAVAWIAGLAVLAASRHRPHVRAEPAGMDEPPEGPAVAGLLCGDFVVPSETAPAILLDLAARGVVDLEEIQPGKTICRLHDDKAGALSPAEAHVLDAVREKAISGVVPADALTTGTDDQSKAWHRELARDVIADAQGAGLTHDRWPKGWLSALGLGVGAIIALIVIAFRVGGDIKDRDIPLAIVAGALAVGAAAVGSAVIGRLGRSLAQLPTDSGMKAAARVAGLARQLRDDKALADLPPAAVQLRGRHLAYAAAFGAAPLAVELLPMGREDDHRAWSRYGGRWRRVRVRYPRALPPAWGKRPAFAMLLALFWGAVAVAAIIGLDALGSARRPTELAANDWEWVGRVALILTAPAVLVLIWGAWVLVRAFPDLWRHQSVTGEIVRDRRFRQLISSSNDPRYWYYLAIDDGTGDHVRALRLSQSLWQEHNQGENVVAEVTPNLRFVRALRTDATSTPGQPIRSSG
jgi:predicted membrane protein DUF2207